MDNIQQQITDINAKLDKLIKDNRGDKVSNTIQNIAVLAIFFFGISTLHDVINKIKK